MTGSKLPFPKQGIPENELLKEMEEARNNDAKWHDGFLFSLVYHANDEHKETLKKAHNMFFSENALSPLHFPSLRKFEAEVIAMTIDLLGGDRKAVGSMTSGGTESNMLAVKTYRDWARAERPDIKHPEMILPISAHPSFDKGAHYFDIKPVHIPLTEDFIVDIDAVKEAINENTILIIGSAPELPRGMVDPIPKLGSIAKENNLGFHVDSCLGGFMLPFLRKLGYTIPDFDLSVPGVSSISADIHKYGYSPKGASTLTFKSEKIRKYQFYSYVDWPGGVYMSPAMPGTRSGAVVAAAWASLKSLGEEGYLNLARLTMETSKKLQDGINSIPELYILGKPDMTVFSFGSDNIDMYLLGDAMGNKDWHPTRLQFPPCLHLIINPKHAEVADIFLEDLKLSVNEVKGKPLESSDGAAAIYGMAATVPDRNKVKDMVKRFLANQYKL